MKKYMFFFLIIMSSSAAQAQWKADGTTLGGFSFTDVNNQTHSSTNIIANGKHIIIDFGATWCSNCWNYHQSHILENYWQQYGANSASLQDAEVIFYEADPSTNNLVTSQFGDWTQGVSYTIADENFQGNVATNFWAGSGNPSGFPAVFVLCNDSKMYRLSTSLTSVSGIRSFVNSKCGTAPLSTTTFNEVAFAYDIYPNPANDQLNIKVDLDKRLNITLNLTNTMGQIVSSKELNEQTIGLHDYTIQTSDLSSGMYFLNMTIGEKQVAHRVMIAH